MVARARAQARALRAGAAGAISALVFLQHDLVCLLPRRLRLRFVRRASYWSHVETFNAQNILLFDLRGSSCKTSRNLAHTFFSAMAEGSAELGSPIGAGRMGAVFRAGAHEAVKFERVQNKGDKLALRDISEEEVDALCVAYELVTATGLSPHILRPLRKAEYAPGTGLVTEYLRGVRTAGGKRVCALRDVIAAGLADEFVAADGCDAFPALLKAVLFQVTFTVAMWCRATDNGFRHNDLNAYNVCVTQFRPDGAAVRVVYKLPTPDGSGERTFVLHTPYRAVIVDFGFAALLPVAGGADFDARFYVDNFADPDTAQPLQRAGAGFKEIMFHKSGMSHSQPCAHYDILFFMYAVRQEMVRGASTATAAATASRRAFLHMYSAVFCDFHSSALCFADFPGRLRPAAQASLLKTNGMIKLGKGNARAHALPSAAAFAFHSYFSEFQTPQLSSSAPAYGFFSNSCAPEVDLRAMRKSVCSLAKPAKAVLNSGVQVDRDMLLLHKPVPGMWRDVRGVWAAIRARVRSKIKCT